MAKKLNHPIHIGWYARDGYVDIFPKIANRLEQLGFESRSFYACHRSDEERRLQHIYGIFQPWLLPRFLKENENKLDISDQGMKRLGETYKERSLIQCLWSEMFLKKKFTEIDYRKHLAGHINFWEEFLNNNRIDVLVTEIPSILSNCIAWILCKLKGIPYLAFIDVPQMWGRTAFSTSFEAHFDNLIEKIENLTHAETANLDFADQYLGQIDNIGMQKAMSATLERPEIENQGIFFKRLSLSIRDIPSTLKKARKVPEYYIYSTFKENVKNVIRTSINNILYPRIGLFNKDIDPNQDNYFLFPLHQKTEWSNFQLFGLAIGDPLNTIREVSYCMPLRSKLYVKEHTAQFGERELSELENIKKNRGVKLINPFFDTQLLIKNSQAVITHGSTLGFEAFIMRKPVILLSKAWYHSFPGVYYVETPEKLSILLQNAQKLPVATRLQIMQCIQALYEISFDGYLYPPSKLLEPENISSFAKALKEKLESLA